MVEGYVNDLLEPVVEIGLVQGGVITAISAIVDTGFSGYLCLSERHIDHVDMTFEFAEAYELANGEIIVRDVFQGTVWFDGVEREIQLILTASQDTLIGASLLQDYNLNVDYPGQTVRIR